MLDLIETYQNIKAVDKLDQALLVDSQKVIRVLSEKVAGLYALTVSDDIETIKNEVENG